MNLKPTVRKIVVSLGITAVWYGFIAFTKGVYRCSCDLEVAATMNSCVDYHSWLPYKQLCHCGCTSLGGLVFVYLFTIVLPFAIVYLIMSSIQDN